MNTPLSAELEQLIAGRTPADGAKAILDAGYGKQLLVTTLAGLDALPPKTLVIDSTREVLRRQEELGCDGHSLWQPENVHDIWDAEDLRFPVRVLDLPR